MGGIYMIYNKISKKAYIGQSICPLMRRKQHYYELKRGKHHNPHLQNSFNKYGEDNFEFIIIEDCEDIDLDEKEKYWIDRLQTCKYGYNIREGGDYGGKFHKIQ